MTAPFIPILHLAAWLFLWLVPLRLCAETPVTAGAHWWSAGAERALTVASTNRAEIVQALNEVPEAQREGMQFLIEHMPVPDLTTLSAAFLKENLALAYEAFAKAPWRERVPKEIFFNDILPYASVNESRDAWRRKLYDLAAPLVADCQTPAEAAQRLNQKLFKLTGVRYSTQRRRADQGPLETMETGMATCTGLSILLVDACRAVGVPARVVATPIWFNKRGNHTWVEIWDGDWHFTGAAEPDARGLNRGWFKHDASQALKDVREHAIYASSFAKTGLSFPLVWASSVQYVSAVNVTERYTPKAQPAETNKVRLLVKVLDRPAGKRVAAKVVITDATNAGSKLEGTSRDESVDLNDILPFALARDRAYEVRVEQGEQVLRREFRPGTNGQELLVVTINDTPAITLPS
jgi:Transglutaminase-like superfamily